MDFVGNTRETVVVDDSESSGSTKAAGAAESETAMKISAKSEKTLAKYGHAACRIAYIANRIDGEGATVCSIESGIPVRGIASAILAFAEYERTLDHAIERGLDGIIDFYPAGSAERKLLDEIYVRAHDLESWTQLDQLKNELSILRGMEFSLTVIGVSSRFRAITANFVDQRYREALARFGK